MRQSLFSKNERKILFFTNAAHFLAHTFILVFPSIATPLSADLSLPFEQVLKLSFLMYLFYGLGALPAGLISDRLPPKASITIYFLGAGGSSLLVNFSQSRMQLLFALMMLGIFLSLYHPVGMGLISKFGKNRGMALGINGTFGSVGIAAAPFLAGLISYLSSWRYIYILLGIASIIFGLVFIFVKIILEHEGEAIDALKQEEDNSIRPLHFLLLCVSFLFAGFVYRGQTLVLPTYLEQNAQFLYNFVKTIPLIKLEGTKTLSATILTSLVYIISIFGQLLGGRIADRYELRYSYFFFFACSLPFLILMYYFKDVPLFFASSFFIMLTIGMQPIENSLIAKFTPSRWRSTGFGIKFVLTFGVSSLVIYPIGFFQVNYSLAAVFLLFSLFIGMLIVNNFILILITRGMDLRN
jgi:MFS family permease